MTLESIFGMFYLFSSIHKLRTTDYHPLYLKLRLFLFNVDVVVDYTTPKKDVPLGGVKQHKLQP